MHYNVVIFTDTTDNIASIPAIGPYKCAHVLRKNGYTCLVVNHLSEYNQEEFQTLVDTAIGPETFLVGFSTSFLKSIQIERDPTKPTPPYPEIDNNTVFPQGKDFENYSIDIIKQKNPHVKFVAGGTKIHPNYANRNIDYACIGFSEISIVNLANHITKKTALNKAMKNIWGIVILDDRMAPDYHFANEDMVWLPIDVVNHKCLPIEIGRGCVFKCKFCSYPLNGKKSLDFVKQADILKQELQSNYDLYGITNYQIVDDTFNDHNEKLDMIVDVVKQLSFVPNFWAYTRLDLLHTRPDTVEKLHDIGLRAFFFGIETLHPQAGRFVGKGYDFKKSINTVKLIREKYPKTTMHGSFIIGLPYESVDHVTATFKRLITQDIPLHSWKFYPLMIEEPTQASFNSDISLNYQKYGYKKIGNITPRVIDWQNEFMTLSQAVNLRDQFTHDSVNHESYKLEGTLIFPLSSMGLDLDTLVNSSYKDFNFNHVEYQIRPNFINEYKKQLLNLIKS